MICLTFPILRWLDDITRQNKEVHLAIGTAANDYDIFLPCYMPFCSIIDCSIRQLKLS